MAKTKQQKQLEAKWRQVRGDLVHAFRNGSDHSVAKEYGTWYIEKREQIWLDYRALPRAWRDTAMDGWNLPDNLRQRLEELAVEELAVDIDQATQPVAAPARRMRL